MAEIGSGEENGDEPAWPEGGEDLSRLRLELDRVDDAILEGVARRMALAERVARVKRAAAERTGANSGLVFRPSREAAIIRRLVERSGGSPSAATIARLWREIFAASYRAQSGVEAAELTVAVATGPSAPWLGDLAREHFGAATPLLACDAPSAAWRAMSQRRTALAVLPRPEEGEPWWRMLPGGGPRDPKILAALPFAPSHGWRDDRTAVVVGRAPLEPSGDDVTVCCVAAPSDYSRARVREGLGASEEAARWLAVDRRSEDATLHLLEWDGYHVDAASNAAREPLSVAVIGCYARPIARDPSEGTSLAAGIRLAAEDASPPSAAT